MLNSVSENQLFRKTGLYRTFTEDPLGFIDIGAAGGVHPVVMPIASLVHCTCFEPDEHAYRELLRAYGDRKVFSKMTIYNTAVGAGTSHGSLYVTKSAVNTSLLEPCEELVNRYCVAGFQVEKVLSVRTRSLDDILAENKSSGERQGEFIKMDCQGAEYLILRGAERTLSHCMALMCEVEFFPMYKNQKIFSEIDLYLREKGFHLYGLYPHYISAKRLDRRRYDSEERIVWADALYFRDPLAGTGGPRKFSSRDIEAVLMAAISSCYYDFALEIADWYYRDHPDEKASFQLLVTSLAEARKRRLEKDAVDFAGELGRSSEAAYLLAKKFIDRHKANNSVDFIAL